VVAGVVLAVLGWFVTLPLITSIFAQLDYQAQLRAGGAPYGEGYDLVFGFFFGAPIALTLGLSGLVLSLNGWRLRRVRGARMGAAWIGIAGSAWVLVVTVIFVIMFLSVS
jgi:hypothetical protein